MALARIERFLTRTGMSACAFGRAAVGDHKFLLRLRRGGNVTLRLVEDAEAFMAAADGGAPELAQSAPDSDCGAAAA